MTSPTTYETARELVAQTVERIGKTYGSLGSAGYRVLPGFADFHAATMEVADFLEGARVEDRTGLLEGVIDEARERIAVLFGIDSETEHVPALGDLVARLETDQARDRAQWMPTVVALMRRLRDREHPRDRRPGDPAPYAVVFEEGAGELELHPRAGITYGRDEILGKPCRVITLEEIS